MMRSVFLVATVFMAFAAVGVIAQSPPAPAPGIPKPNPRLPNGAWAGALKEHPRLLGPRTHLQALAKAKPDLYKAIKAEVMRDPKPGLHMLPLWGIVQAVDGLPKGHVDAAIALANKHVARGVTNEHQDTWIALTEAVFVYDLFHDAMSAGDRQKLVEWANAHLGKFAADENAFHNSTLSKILTYLRVAYATWGAPGSRAQEFRDHALVKLFEGKIVPVLNEFGQGGGFTECGWYARGSLWHLVQTLELARLVEGYDGFQKAPRFFYQRLAYEMHQPYPGLWMYGAQRYAVEGDGAATYGGHNEYPRHLRTVLAQYFRGSELSRFVANGRRKGSNMVARAMDFLYEDPPEGPLDQPLPMKDLPLSHLASGAGKLYARSDWADDATWFRFECGDFWNHHQHFETGNFEIFRFEPLATESGEYHDYNSNHAVNWLLRTVAHNCILVNQPGEQWSQLRDGGRNKYANDGGQAKKWNWPVDNLEQWKAKRQDFERGDTLAYENTPAWMYVAGDCTASYAASKLQSWVRQIVFVRPGTFVIFDRVVSTKPEYAKTWLLHCRNEPQMRGDGATITDGKGKLVVVTLLPQNAKVSKVEGYTYGGQTFDPPPSAHAPYANLWRLEVVPASPATEDLFLHVLFTVEPQPVMLVRDGQKTGATIGDAQVLFSGNVGGAITTGGKTTPLEANVKLGKYE